MRKLLFCLSLLFITAFSACTSRNNRLSSDTLTINPEPSAPQTVALGGTLALKAICKSANSDNADVTPAWTVENNLGSFNPTSGKSTTFTAGRTSGTGKIYATFGGIRGSLNLTVGSGSSGGTGGSSDYVIFDDTFRNIDGSVGVAKDAGSSMTLGEDAVIFSQGNKSFKAIYSITDGLLGYVGWFVGKTADTNMSAYASGHVKFDIRTGQDLQIGIRSSNINPSTNSAKIFLSDLGISPNPSSFQSVSIPVSTFVADQPGTDLTKMVDLFIISAIGSRTGPQTNQPFWVDNIRWTSN